MQRLINFIKYNNAVSIAFGLLFLSFGGVFAASPDLRGTIISSEQRVWSVDNTAIVQVDLTTYAPTVTITNVTENDEQYEISFIFKTIDVSDGIWQEVTKSKTTTVKKTILKGEDLGLYLAEEFSELTQREFLKLNEVQEIEKKNGLTSKVIATVYSGLIGQLIDSKQETFTSYTPVIPPTPKKTRIQYLAEVTQQKLEAQNITAATTTITTSTNTVAPVIILYGNNPANILVGSSYIDLGAQVIDDTSLNLGYTVALNGVEVKSISIDTSTSGTHTILYKAVDQDGNIGTATRVVIVSSLTQEIIKTTTETSTSTEITTETATTTPDVVDTILPIITLIGNPTIQIVLSTTTPYTDAGATALDDVDGDITLQIVIDNPVDASTPREYIVSYNVTDAAGNSAVEVTRVVTVIAE